MNILGSAKICVKKSVDFKGRASRLEIWLFHLICCIIIITSIFIDEYLKEGERFIYIAYAALIIPSSAVCIRRLHDVNITGWAYLLVFIPYIGPLFLLAVSLTKGVAGINKYGRDPLEIIRPVNDIEITKSANAALIVQNPISRLQAFAVGLLLSMLIILSLFLTRTFAFEPFSMPSGSMAPTLLVGDYFLVSKYPYGYSKHSLPFGLPLIKGRIMANAPKRGDLTTFKLPSDNKIDYVKRIVGLPGDRIQMKGGILHVNGEPVRRERVADYVERDSGGTSRMAQYTETLPNGYQYPIIEVTDQGRLDETDVYSVPEGHYFMMGDNRDNSLDSRVLTHVGYVPFENLVGRVEVIFWGPGRIRIPQ